MTASISAARSSSVRTFGTGSDSPTPALSNTYDVTKRGELLHECLEFGHGPDQLDVADERPSEDELDRPVAEHLIRQAEIAARAYDVSGTALSVAMHTLLPPTSAESGPDPAPRRGVARYPLAGSQRRYGTCWLASGDTILTWNDSGDGRGDMTAAALVCGSCGTELPPNSKFCNECGAPVTTAATSAEYKQVTVLFADVVHSMDIAAAVGAERLREIMAELVDRCAAVVQRYGGTVDKFTGDGIMAVFGAPVALEDHAVRACLAALGVQEEAKRLAVEVQERDGVDLRLRVGLNSGQVIAGEIGSGPFGYTAVGEQVGMAQRMESVAPPGGVMLSASTARLVEGAATLGEPEMVQIKGADEPVPARRLLGMANGHRAVGRAESTLVGRRWEMSAVEGLLDRAIDGHGAVVGVVGSPGIGKSRLVREVAAMASRRGVEVFTAFCESHTSQVPFHAVARLLRAATGVEGLDGAGRPRSSARPQFPTQTPRTCCSSMTCWASPIPMWRCRKIDPDARRRRLTALVNAASLARETPGGLCH